MSIHGLSLALVASVLAASWSTSCAILYDFGGDGGASSSRDATTTTTTTALASTSTSAERWCRDELCFGATCALDVDECKERVIDLPANGQRVHIYSTSPSPSVVAVAWDDTTPGTMRTVQFKIVSPTTEDAFAGPTSTDNDVGSGFVAHDTQSVVFMINTVPKQLGLYDIQSKSVELVLDLDQDFQAGTNDVKLNAMQPFGSGWIALAGQELIGFNPEEDANNPFTQTGLSLGGVGHSLVKLNKDNYAFSAYGDPGRIAVATRNSASWETNRETPAVHALGIAADASEVFYRAQVDAAGTNDVVGAWNPETGLSRIVATSATVSAQAVAVDSTHVYFDGGTGVADEWSLFKCPKALSDQDATATCERIHTRSSPPVIGGMASERLEAGTANERYLTCYAMQAELHCRVTR